jgi:ABC-type glycerol-3-phosphate transport system substrate-binding protein
MYAKLIPFTPAAAINGGGNEMTTAFVQGDAAMMINATGYYSIIVDPAQSKIVGNFGLVLPPRASSDARTLMFGWLIGMGENSKNKDAAWQFLEYAMGKANATKMIDLGAPPAARMSLVNDAATLEKLPYLPILVDAAAVGTHLPYLPAMTKIIPVLSVELNKMGTGQQSVDDFIANANAAVGKILDEAGGCQ